MVKGLTSVQIIISRFMSLSPMSGSLLSAESASHSLPPSLSVLPPLACTPVCTRSLALSLPLSLKNKLKKKEISSGKKTSKLMSSAKLRDTSPMYKKSIELYKVAMYNPRKIF